MNIILIPVYNDWKSLNHLLVQIDKQIKTKNFTKILIINDSSTQRIKVDKKRLNKISQIKILTIKKKSW